MYEHLADRRLQVVVDDLDEIAFDQLREASAEGRPARSTTSGSHRRGGRREGDPSAARRRQASTNELTVSISSRWMRRTCLTKV